MGVKAFELGRTALSIAWLAATLSAGCSGDMVQTAGRTGGPTQPGVGGGAGSPAVTTPIGSLPSGTGSTGISSQLPSSPISAAPKTCAEGMAETEPVKPTVWLVVDGSGSMAEKFGTGTRWSSLRDALMAPDGVVQPLQAFVKFGLVIYSGAQQQAPACNAPAKVSIACGCYTGAEPACCTAACGGTPPAPTGACADLVTVQPALSNFAMLDSMYPARQIGGWTPTDRALDQVVNTLPVLNTTPGPDMKKDPILVVLATDGAPNDQCASSPPPGGGTTTTAGGTGSMTSGGGSGFQADVASRVINIVTSGVQKGMKMFVISLAGDDAELQSHLEQVAKIGSPGTPPFVPSTKNDLAAALQKIIGGATCQVRLNGTVEMGQECSGQVSMNGATLPCNSDNGWRLSDPSTVQLTGTACTSFLSAASGVHAAFPCAVFHPG